jgi:serine O-acetyltransferase
VRVDGRRPDGPDADWAHLPDPIADAIAALSARVAELEAALEQATGREVEPSGEPVALRRRGGSDPAAG